MRARHRRFSSPTSVLSGPARTPSSQRVGGASRFVHVLTAFVFLMGMIAPYVTATAVAAAPASKPSAQLTFRAAQQPNTPPPLPRPNAVVVGGDFQTALGCSDNFDKECDITALQPGDDGTWTGSFPIPPGSYSFNVIVRTDDGDIALGENGLAKPDADDNSVNVPDGAVGVYFSYNRYTGEVIAAPYSNQIEVQVDGGQTFLVAPSPGGGWDGYIDAGPGGHSGQFLVDGQPFGDPFDFDGGDSGRVHFQIDGDGNVQNIESVSTATLTVFKTDDNGNGLTGSCFTVYAGDNVAGQECDASDGEDGSTTIQFPNGIPGGRLTLAESRVPDGQAEAEDQRVSLDPGDNQVQVTVGGGETPPEDDDDETPTGRETPTGTDVSFRSIDQDTGDVLGGACFSIDDSDPNCDEDGDGVVEFSGIEPGSHTLTETTPPEGYEGIGTVDFDLPDGGGQYDVPHTAAASTGPATGNFQVHIRDDQGNPLPDACVTITPRGSTPGDETRACDGDDGNDDGEVFFSDIPEGRWRLAEDTPPDGYEAPDPVNITIRAGETGEETLEHRSAGPSTGTIAATTVDQNGNELPEVCYDLSDFGEQCDGNDDDNVMTQDDVPPGDYNVTVQVPNGYEIVGDDTQQVTVEAGQTAEVQFQVQEAEVEPETGSLQIHVRDGDGNPLGGACFTAEGPQGQSGDVCDDEGDGELAFTVQAGDYTVTQTQAQDGYEVDSPQSTTVEAGSTAEVTFVNQSSEPPPAETGSLRILIQDGDGFAILGACVDYNGSESGSVCDNDQGDSDGDDGSILIEDLDPGDYSVSMQPIEGFQAAEQQNTTVEAGQEAQVTLVSGAEPQTGSLIINKQDADGNPLPGACFTVGDGPEVCDNQEGDSDPADGVIQIDNLEAGQPVLEETRPPEGYEPDRVRRRVRVTAGETRTYDIVNNPLATPTPTPVPTGNLVAYTNDDQGNPVGGVCYEVTNYGQVCDEDGDGDMGLPDSPAGEYTVQQVSVPDGYDLDPNPQTQTLEGGARLEFTFVSPRQNGSITITKTDGENPLGGACFSVDGSDQVCDDVDGENDGTIVIENVAPGEHEVAEAQVPEGYNGADSQTVEVQPGQNAEVTFVNTPQTGSLVIHKQDENGDPLGGACFEVGGTQVCDDQDGDNNPDPGEIEVTGLTPGNYDVVETQAPEGYQADADTESVDVPAGGSGEVTFVNARQTGSLSVTVSDGTNPVAGACVSIDGGEAICDNQDGDNDPADGVIEVTGLEPGDHTVAISGEVQGLDIPAGQTVNVPAGGTGEVTLTLTPQAGSILITKTDGQDPLGGACFSVDGGEQICDNGDGDGDDSDGSILIANVTPGQHEVTETQAPEGYDPAADPQTVDVPAGGTGEVTFVNTLIPTEEPTEAPTETPTEEATPTETPTEEATPTETPTEEPSPEATPTEQVETGGLHIAKVDENGDPLGGACFSVDGPDSVNVCDNGDGDQDGDDGSIRLADLAAGTYTVTETGTPDGYLPADSQDVEVVGGEEAEVQIQNQPAPTPTPTETPEPDTGSIAISKVNENGEPLDGACFAVTGLTDAGPVCDNSEGDLDDATGTIQIGGLLEGDYVVSETTPPDGYTAGADQNVTVTAGDEPATVEFANQPVPPETGNVRISSTAQDGGPAGAGCYTVGSTDVCDNGDGDSDAAPGQVLVEGIIVGTYDVVETDAPSGYLQNTDTQTVDVPADGEGTVEFVHDLVPPATGSVTFNLDDPDGNPVVGGCLNISDTSNAGGTEYCDGGPQDTDQRDGILGLVLETGTYSAIQSELPQPASSASTAPGAAGAMRSFLQDGSLTDLPGDLELDEKTFTVKANVVIIIIIIIIIIVPEEGDLVIIKRADDTNKLQGGACFKITGPGGELEYCDNDNLDEDGTTGVIRFNDLAFGDYDVEETVIPPGYQKAADRTVEIGFGVRTITIRNEPVTETTGKITIKKVDEDGNPLTGSCFELRQNNVVVVPAVCDDANGTQNDGLVVFNNVPAGTYKARETVLPSNDYVLPPDQTVTSVPGQSKVYQVVNTLKPGDILITKLDDQGQGPLPGACFALERGSGIEYEVCDQETGDGDLEEGIILFEDIPADDWTLIETQAPAGYAPGPDQDITVEPGETLNLQIENEEAPPQPEGNLKVFKVNGKNQPLPGACFSLKQGNVTVVPAVCDNADGNNDGTINFTGVPAGAYKLHETKKPAASYQTVADVNVTIVANTTKSVKVVNTLKPGRILVIKVNEKGYPLQNACFDLAPDNTGPKCTNASGEVSFDNLDPTVVYKLTETKAPLGYQIAPPKTNITVDPGLTTEITIKDKKVPPPDDTGSIKVIKFFCPAGKSGEVTVTYDSSDPGPKKLAQTANCKKGNAEFVLERSDGQGDPEEFHTGNDGEFQATLPAGEYELTEQATDVTVEIEIFDSQQTTIVVLNFVKPPEPAPAQIKVIKYTCDAGFEGSYYADFVNNCVDPNNLTNGVTFRISGEAAQKHDTGDKGQKGQTTFTQLPSGGYTLEEEPPAGATTVYGFCGLDPDAPDYKTVDEDISFNLGEGDVFTCTFFNIPADLTDSTGAIKVTKYVCDLPGNKRPANFDWFAECSIETDGVKFTLSVSQSGKFVPKSTGITNADGILNFSNLKPGTYQLKEVGADWCHAESDNVNPQGNVIVRAGQRTNVWIFNCEPTKNPPNTGAGTTAPPQAAQAPVNLSGLDPADSNDTLLFAAIWPLLGLALYGWRRNHRRSYRRAA